MPKLPFKTRKPSHFNSYEIEPTKLKGADLKLLNKPHAGQTHFVGIIAEGDTASQLAELVKNVHGSLNENSEEDKNKSVSKSGASGVDDKQLLLSFDEEDSDSESSEEKCAGSETREGSEVKPSFDIHSVCYSLGICERSDANDTKPDMFREIFCNLCLEILDKNNTYMFNALLPTKDIDAAARVHHWLVGFLVMVDPKLDHVNCEAIKKKLDELKTVVRFSRKSNNIFSAPENVQKPRLVFFSGEEQQPMSSPARSDLESQAHPCCTCLELKSVYKCVWASDIKSAFVSVLDQQIVSKFPQFVRLVNMKLAGLY